MRRPISGWEMGKKQAPWQREWHQQEPGTMKVQPVLDVASSCALTGVKFALWETIGKGRWEPAIVSGLYSIPLGTTWCYLRPVSIIRTPPDYPTPLGTCSPHSPPNLRKMLCSELEGQAIGGWGSFPSSPWRWVSGKYVLSHAQVWGPGGAARSSMRVQTIPRASEKKIVS